MKLHENRQLFADAVRMTAETMGIAPEFVEKDYWICLILQKLSRHPNSDSIVWKGGTSLSKAYSLIQRFSSDVDFAVIAEGLSQNQLKKLVTRIGKDTTEDLTEKEVEGQTHKSTRYRKTYHQYDSIIAERNARYKFLGNHVVVEINTYGNPFPYVRKEIYPFITDMMAQRGLNDIIHEMDMEPFTLNVLDKRRTLCEKVVSLLRFSFEDDPIQGLSAKIRHFYDLHFLTHDPECMEYLKAEFTQNLLDLIEHDKREYDRPPLWRDADLRTSVLFTDFDNLWQKLSPLYQTEVGALSYSDIPDKEIIAESIKNLLFHVINILKNKM
jgi:hypothetical protein